MASSDDMSPIQKIFLYAFGVAWIPSPPDGLLDKRRRTTIALTDYVKRLRMSSLATAGLLLFGYAQIANTIFQFAPEGMEFLFPPELDMELIFNVGKTWLVGILGVPATVDFYLRLTRIAEHDHKTARGSAT